MVNRAGLTTWAVAISDDIDPALQLWDEVGLDSPAGNILYFFSQNFRVEIQDMDKIKHLPALKSFTTKLGRGKQMVQFKGIIPSKLVSELNNYITYTNTWRKPGAIPVYVWARGKEVAGTWDAVKFMDSSGNMQDFLRSNLRRTVFEINFDRISVTVNAEEVAS